MIQGLSRWIDARLRPAKFLRKAMNHVFPDHWSFMLGEIALYSFAVLVITGVFLTMFFNASDAKEIYHGSYHQLDGVQMSASYKSVLDISFDVRAGLLMRQIHHWAALIFLGAIVIHLARIFFTAAYRKPREINWIIGVTLLLLAMFNGYFGYSLLGNLLSGAGLRIAYAIMMSAPVVGPWLAYMVLGGNVPSDIMTPHMYGLHVFVIPVLIALLLAAHVGIIWRQFHTNYPGPHRTNDTIVGSRLWPSYTAKSVGLFFMLCGVLSALGAFVQIDPVWVFGPYNPIAIMPGAQPDWYLGWVEGAMRLFPGVNLRVGPWLIPEVFFPGLLLPAIVFGLLYAYPFLEQLFTLDFQNHNVLALPYQKRVNAALGCAMFTFLLVLFVAGGDDVIAMVTNTSVVDIRTWLRILVFIAPVTVGALVFVLCGYVQQRRRARDKTLAAEEVFVTEEGIASD